MTDNNTSQVHSQTSSYDGRREGANTPTYQNSSQVYNQTYSYDYKEDSSITYRNSNLSYKETSIYDDREEGSNTCYRNTSQVYMYNQTSGYGGREEGSNRVYSNRLTRRVYRPNRTYSYGYNKGSDIVYRNTNQTYNQTSDYGDREKDSSITYRNISQSYNQTSTYGHKEVDSNITYGNTSQSYNQTSTYGHKEEDSNITHGNTSQSYNQTSTYGHKEEDSNVTHGNTSQSYNQTSTYGHKKEDSNITHRNTYQSYNQTSIYDDREQDSNRHKGYQNSSQTCNQTSSYGCREENSNIVYSNRLTNRVYRPSQTSRYRYKEVDSNITYRNTSQAYNQTSRYGDKEITTNCGVGLNGVPPDLHKIRSRIERYRRELNDNNNHSTSVFQTRHSDNVTASIYPPKQYQSFYGEPASENQTVTAHNADAKDFGIGRTDTTSSVDPKNDKTVATTENGTIKLIKIESHQGNRKSVSRSWSNKEPYCTNQALNETGSTNPLINKLPVLSATNTQRKSRLNVDNSSASDSANGKKDTNNIVTESSVRTILSPTNMQNTTKNMFYNDNASTDITAKEQINLNKVRDNGSLQLPIYDTAISSDFNSSVHVKNDKEISVSKISEEPCNAFDRLNATRQELNQTMKINLFISQPFENRLKMYAANYDGYKTDGSSAQRENYSVINKDITEVQADVLVCHLCGGSGDPFTSGPISRLFMEKGSQELVDAYYKTPGVFKDELTVTESYGELRSVCKKVFFIHIIEYKPDSSDNCFKHMISRVECCLVKLSELNLRSIAFTSMGCGLMNYPPSSVARNFRSVIDVVTVELDLDIKITIATKDANIYSEFLKFFPGEIPATISEAPAASQVTNDISRKLNSPVGASNNVEDAGKLKEMKNKNVSKNEEKPDIVYPSYWPKLGATKRKKERGDFYYITTDLQTGSAIYDEVKKLVLKTFDTTKIGLGINALGLTHKTIQVVRIRCVRNPYLYMQYCRRRAEFQTKSNLNSGIFVKSSTQTSTANESGILSSNVDSEINECYLFHGTTNNGKVGILQSGCDNRLSNTGLFGYGIYFSDSTTKADQYSDKNTFVKRKKPKDGTSKLLFMFLCRVILGNSYICKVANPDLRKPPCKNQCQVTACVNPAHVPHFDSVTGKNNLAGQPLLFREFIVYEKNQCYPEFLIEYKRVY